MIRLQKDYSENTYEAIGFTNDNVRTLLDDVSLPEQYDMIAEWHNGNIFGRDRRYFPWDVFLYRPTKTIRLIEVRELFDCYLFGLKNRRPG